MTIVVSKDLPESQARILIDHYDQLYSDAHTIIIDLHCDDVFANETAIKNPNLKDAQYYSHVHIHSLAGEFLLTSPVRNFQEQTNSAATLSANEPVTAHSSREKNGHGLLCI